MVGGGIVGTAGYDWLERHASLAAIMRVGLVVETLTHLGLALTTTPWVAMVVLFVFGVHAFVWGTTSRTVRMRAVPARLQGRVGSLYSIGVFGGIVAGQAWECEAKLDLSEYQRQKTGALFAAACVAGGAAAAHAEPESWRLLGDRLGEAYQVADDLRDAVETEASLGKPVGRDAALSAVVDAAARSRRDGRAELVLVTGEAGMGKSRLAWEFEKHADGISEEILWHRGRCLSYGQGITFWPVREMLGSAANWTEEDTAA